MGILSNRYVVAFGVPVGVLVIGALAKKLVRKDAWQREDFYLGIELALAAIAGDLGYLLDLAGNSKFSHAVAPLTFLLLALVLLLVLMAEHQDWAKRMPPVPQQVIRLCFIGNIIGAGLLAAFTLYVKGITAIP